MMKKQLPLPTAFIVLIIPLIISSGCNPASEIDMTVTSSPNNALSTITGSNMSTSITSIATRTPVINKTKSIVTIAPTRHFTPTLSPTFQPTRKLNPIIPGGVTKDLLIVVEEDKGLSTGIRSVSSNSIWILRQGESLPQEILNDPQFSYETPSWSHDGNWIAFRQRKAFDLSSYQLGIINKDGTRKHIFQNEFGTIGHPFWSVDDNALVFETLTSQGTLPFLMDIDKGDVNPILPNRKNNSSHTLIALSPNENKVFWIGFGDNPGSLLEILLISLDDNRVEKLQIPEEVSKNCTNGFTTGEWSPNGKSFLVQFKGFQEAECWPELWLYRLDQKTWTSVIRLPAEVPSYMFHESGTVAVSNDNLWLAWSTTNIVLIYETKNWDLVRKIDFDGFESLMAFPWVKDINGNSIFSIVRVDFSTFPKDSMDIIGISPNGTKDKDTVLVRLEGDILWVPEKAYFTPMLWGP